MKEDMRGLFFLVKGKYIKGVEPSFNNKVTSEVSYLGGYNPESENTNEWYMVLDKKTFHCVSCGGVKEKVLKGVYHTIKKYKGDAKKYFKHLSDISSEDYYEITYLGHRPLDDSGYKRKAVGRCPKVSPYMKDLYGHVYEVYGDYYSEEVEVMEDLAYEELKEETPFKKNRKLVSKNKKTLEKTPKKEKEVIETKTPKRVKPKIKLGVKKLSLS